MITKRLGQYITTKGISFYQFENTINASRGSISKAVKYNKNIGSNVIENILNNFTDLNPIWLLTGSGAMFIDPELQEKKKQKGNQSKNLDDFDKLEIIDYVSDNIDDFRNYSSFKKLTKLLFADEEIGSVMKDIKQLKKQVSKLARESH